MKELAQEATSRGERVAIICTSDMVDNLKGLDAEILVLGTGSDVLRNLFYFLNEVDRMGIGHVIAQGLPSDGIYAAYMDRIVKASGGNLVE